MKYTLKKAIKEFKAFTKFVNKRFDKCEKYCGEVKTVSNLAYGDAAGYTVITDKGHMYRFDGNDVYIKPIAEKIVYINKEYRYGKADYSCCDTIKGNYNIKDDFQYPNKIKEKFNVKSAILFSEE